MLELGELLKEGKGKRVYATNDPDTAVVYYKDETVAFHGLKRGRILGKGEVNNAVCKHIFTMLAEKGVENREQAYYDMAMLTEEMIMRNRTHGGYKVLLDDLFEFVEQYNADMIILWEHITCKALDGMHGLFEDRARELGIPLIWVDHQLFDPRVVTRQGVRDQVNNYMRTVMQEEPLDPTLEVLDDENVW